MDLRSLLQVELHSALSTDGMRAGVKGDPWDSGWSDGREKVLQPVWGKLREEVLEDKSRVSLWL